MTGLAATSASGGNSALKAMAWAGVAALMFLAAGGAALLFFFNPAEHGFYPRCFTKSLFNLDCPGCGGLRATHQLLHGDFLAAFKLNPLFIVLLPVGLFFAFRHVLKLSTGRVIPQPFQSPRWVWVLAIVIIGFGVLRNLPWRSWFGA